MKCFATVCLLYLILAGLGSIVLSLGLIVLGTTHVFAQTPQTEPVTDVYGNVVRHGEQRLNYLLDQQDSVAEIGKRGVKAGK